MATLYILCGLPYSGKSLFSKKIENATSIKRVSFDEGYEELSKSIKDITYDIARLEIERELARNLEKGISVVYDSTNLSEAGREMLINVAVNSKACAEIIYLDVPFAEIYKRKDQSLIDKTHQNDMSNNDIEAAIKRFEIPTDCIIISTEEDKDNFIKNIFVS